MLGSLYGSIQIKSLEPKPGPKPKPEPEPEPEPELELEHLTASDQHPVSKL